jgi:hypothetical protein
MWVRIDGPEEFRRLETRRERKTAGLRWRRKETSIPAGSQMGPAPRRPQTRNGTTGPLVLRYLAAHQVLALSSQAEIEIRILAVQLDAW